MPLIAAKAWQFINSSDVNSLQELLKQVSEENGREFLSFNDPSEDIKTHSSVKSHLLNHAVRRGNSEIIKLLIQHFKFLENEPTESSSFMVDAFKQAILVGRLDIIDLLLQKNFTCFCEDNFLPFSFAYEAQQYEVAIGLPDRGIGLEKSEFPKFIHAAGNLAANNPAEASTHHNNIDTTLRSFFSASDINQESVEALIENNCLKIIHRLLKEGFDPNKYPVLDSAIKKNNAALVLLLLGYGAKFESNHLISEFPDFNNIWNSQGNTILNIAHSEQQIYSPYKPEKAIAILTDWIPSEKNLNQNAPNYDFFKTQQQQLKKSVEQKINLWQKNKPKRDTLIKEIEELTKIAETTDNQLAWRLRFIQGRLKLEEYNIELPTTLPIAENKSFSATP